MDFNDASIEQLMAIYSYLAKPVPRAHIVLIEKWVRGEWKPYRSDGNSIDYFVGWLYS